MRRPRGVAPSDERPGDRRRAPRRRRCASPAWSPAASSSSRWRRSATSSRSARCCPPSRSTWRTCWAATGSRSGLVVGAFAVSAAIVRPWAGRLGDRYGRRVLLSGGSLLVGVVTLAYTQVDAVAGLVGLRLITGLGEAAVFVGAATATQDMAPVAPARRGRLVLQRRALQRARARTRPRRAPRRHLRLRRGVARGRAGRDRRGAPRARHADPPRGARREADGSALPARPSDPASC